MRILFAPRRERVRMCVNLARRPCEYLANLCEFCGPVANTLRIPECPLHDRYSRYDHSCTSLESAAVTCRSLGVAPRPLRGPSTFSWDTEQLYASVGCGVKRF